MASSKMVQWFRLDLKSGQWVSRSSLAVENMEGIKWKENDGADETPIENSKYTLASGSQVIFQNIFSVEVISVSESYSAFKQRCQMLS